MYVFEILSSFWFIHYIVYFFQWYGNQVTCAWWDDIWLHETFARFMEYYGISNGRTPINVDWVSSRSSG